MWNERGSEKQRGKERVGEQERVVQRKKSVYNVDCDTNRNKIVAASLLSNYAFISSVALFENVDIKNIFYVYSFF